MALLLMGRRSALVSIAAAGFSLSSRGAPAADKPVTLHGSTTFNLEVLAEHKDAIERAAGIGLVVVPNKSSLGLLALLGGRADLAMISAPLDQEVGVVRPENPDLPFDRLQAFEVARTRASLIVHPGNPVRTIADADLRRVLRGEADNWQLLGGPDRLIRLVAVRAGGGAVSTVEAAVLGPGQQIAAVNQVRVQNGPQVASVVEQDERAIGITQLKSIDGRQVAELATERPFEQVLFLVSLGPPTPAQRAVIDACIAAASHGTM